LPDGSPRVIASGLSSKQQMNLSPSGNAAVIYSVDRSTLLLITGLANSPNVQRLQLTNKKSLISAAVSDSGLLLLAFAGAEGPEVTWMYRDGSMKPIMTISRLGSMQFLTARDEALVADAGKDTVWLANGAVSGSAPARVAGAAEGLKDPAAIAASVNGRWAIITDRNQGTVLRVDLSHKEPVARVTCSCDPSELAPLTGNAVFRLTSGNSHPLWIFDGDSASPRIVFLPAADQK
jgi:hypothetical protein